MIFKSYLDLDKYILKTKYFAALICHLLIKYMDFIRNKK